MGKYSKAFSIKKQFQSPNCQSCQGQSRTMKKIIFLELFLRIIEDEKWNLFEKLGQLRTPILNPCEVIDNPWLQPSHQCWQDYISLIANSIFLYLATISQLYLFLCYKMNTQRTRPDQHSAVKVALDVNWWNFVLIESRLIFTISKRGNSQFPCWDWSFVLFWMAIHEPVWVGNRIIF